MSHPALPIRLGTRGSPLALVQARTAAEALRSAHGLGETDVSIVPIKTSGDRIQDRALADVGGKALWTRELDQALIDCEVDATVHSMKDVETFRPAEIVLAALLPRADVRDRLIGADSLEALPRGARVGTSSPRRRAQLLRLRPDIEIGLLRGNIETRAAAVAEGRFDATLLAAAGLDRLGRSDFGAAIPVDVLLPAAQQAAIGIETRAGDAALGAFLAAIDDPVTHACIAAERSLLAGLGADCGSPVAALCSMTGDAMVLDAQILAEDGSESVERRIEFTVDRAGIAARSLAGEMLDRASAELRALFAP